METEKSKTNNQIAQNYPPYYHLGYDDDEELSDEELEKIHKLSSEPIRISNTIGYSSKELPF